MHYLKPDPQPKVNVQLCWINLLLKSSWIKTTASGLSYELGVNGERKLMETEILLTKMDIVHFILVNLQILTVSERYFELYYGTVTLKLTVESVPKKVLWLLTSFR